MTPTLKFGSFVFSDVARPPRSSFSPGRTRAVRVQPGYDGEEAVWDFGDTGGFLHTFQTENNVGHLTPTEIGQLLDMEAAKNPFTVETDLFGADGDIKTFTGYFDVENRSRFRPVIQDGSYSAYELYVYLIPQGG